MQLESSNICFISQLYPTSLSLQTEMDGREDTERTISLFLHRDTGCWNSRIKWICVSPSFQKPVFSSRSLPNDRAAHGRPPRHKAALGTQQFQRKFSFLIRESGLFEPTPKPCVRNTDTMLKSKENGSSVAPLRTKNKLFPLFFH